MSTIRTAPQFVTGTDFLNRFGIDLSKRLADDDNPSNKVNVFLLNVEERLMSWIENSSARNYDWNNLTEYQKKYWVLAILKQAYYIFRNSDLSSDSGYDPNKGVVISREDMNKIEISKAVIDDLVKGALINHELQNQYRYFNWQ